MLVVEPFHVRPFKPHRLALLLPFLLLLLLSDWAAQAGSNSRFPQRSSRAAAPPLTLEDVVDLLAQAHAASCLPPQPKSSFETEPLSNC